MDELSTQSPNIAPSAHKEGLELVDQMKLSDQKRRNFGKVLRRSDWSIQRDPKNLIIFIRDLALLFISRLGFTLLSIIIIIIIISIRYFNLRLGATYRSVRLRVA